MKKNIFMRMAMILVVAMAIVILVRANVTFSKEPTINKDGNVVDKILEVNSELVKNIYAKLTLLDDVLTSDNYKYAYFKMKENEREKTLSDEEKLYAVVENLYESGKLEIEEENGKEVTTVKADRLIDEANEMFKGDNLDVKNIYFVPSLKCGITDVLFTGDEYKFTFERCNEYRDISQNNIVSARKGGNYVVLRIKSFYAKYEKKNKKDKLGYYVIKNYNSDEEIVKLPEKEVAERIPAIAETYAIDDYDFYFELRGDNYYLDKISKVEVQ